MSFASFGQEGHHPVLYSLSRDRKLRIWNPTNGSCLKTIEVRSASQELVPHRSQPSSSQSSSALSDNASVPLIRVIPHPSPASRYSHLLVIFLASPHSFSSAGTIDVYRVSPTNDLVYAGERPCSLASAGSHLRGFEIQPPMEKDRFDSGWTLWATWDNKGTISCESVIMDDVFQFQTHVEPQHSSRSLYDWQQASHSTEVEQFDAAYFDDLLSLDPPNPARPYDNADISSIFIHHLFYPARFSSLTLTTAFDEYILQLPKRHLIPQLSAAYPSLSKKYLAVVGCQIEMEMSPQTGAPVVQVFRRDLKLDWLGIWARVRDLDKQARWPVSTAAVEQQLVVFTREGVTASVPEDAIRVVDRLGQSSENVHDFLDLPEGSLKSLFLALTPPTARRCAVALSSVGTSMSTALARQEADEGGSGLELFNDQVNAFLAAPASQPVEALAGSLWDDMVDPYLTEQDRVNVRRLLSECPDTMRGLSESLDLLANLTFPLPGTDISDFNDSGLAKSLITSTIMAVIAARYSFARSILLVSLFHLAQSADEEAEDLIEILNRAVVTYHRYRILKWVSEQTGEEAQTRKKGKRSDKRKQNGGDDMLAEGLGGLKMREGEEEGVDMDGYDVGYSLLHSLLARRSPQTVKKGSISAIHESATSFLSATGLLRKNQVDLEPQSADVELAHRILVDGHAALAGQLSALYPLSSGMAYVRGRAYLEVGDPDSAVRCLQQAAAGCKGDDLC